MTDPRHLDRRQVLQATAATLALLAPAAAWTKSSRSSDRDAIRRAFTREGCPESLLSGCDPRLRTTDERYS